MKKLLVLMLALALMMQCCGCMTAYLMIEGAMGEKFAEPAITPHPELYPLERPAQFASRESSRFLLNMLSVKNYENAMAIYDGVMGFESRIRLPNPMQGDELAQLIRILALECPEMFQCTTENIFEAEFYQEQGKINRVDPHYQHSKDEYETRMAAQEAAVSSILAGTEGMPLYEAMLYCHDTLLGRCEYQKQPDAGTTTAYGALINGKAQCYGYALAMLELLRGLGLDCFCITGVTLNNDTGEFDVKHHWLAVKLEDEWYAIDPTHDDLGGDNIYHANFCVSDSELMSIRDDAFYGGLVELPACTGGRQNYYIKNDSLITPLNDARAEFVRIVGYAYFTGQSTAEMRCSDATQYEQLKAEHLIQRILTS